MREYLSPGRFIDSDHPAVVEFAEKHRGVSRDPVQQAINLYYAVREAVRYNPYTFSTQITTIRPNMGALPLTPRTFSQGCCPQFLQNPSKVSHDINHIGLTTLFCGCRLSSEGWFCPGVTED